MMLTLVWMHGVDVRKRDDKTNWQIGVSTNPSRTDLEISVHINFATEYETD